MIGAITAGLYGTGVPPVTNSYESISTITVGSGGSSSISFSSIPSTYKHLQIRAIGRTARASTTDDIKINFNSDSSSTYARHYFYGNGSTVAAGAVSSTTAGYVTEFPANSSGANIFGGFVMDILDYTNTSKYKTIRTLGGNDQNGSGDVFFASSLWQSTSAITQIDLASFNAANISQYSQFALYGIKG